MQPLLFIKNKFPNFSMNLRYKAKTFRLKNFNKIRSKKSFRKKCKKLKKKKKFADKKLLKLQK